MHADVHAACSARQNKNTRKSSRSVTPAFRALELRVSLTAEALENGTHFMTSTMTTTMTEYACGGNDEDEVRHCAYCGFFSPLSKP
jgi:hypothetical protein